MFRSYLRLTFRTLRRHPGYALSGGVGLIVGLGCDQSRWFLRSWKVPSKDLSSQ